MDRLAPIVVLKLRLALRQGRGAWAWLGIALMLLFFVVPLSLALGGFAYIGLQALTAAGDREFLHLVLAGVWIFWLVFPVVGFSLNQSYDLTKLFIYPLSRRTIFVANLLACFLDPTLLLVLPLFVVIAVSYSASVLVGFFSLVVLLLFLAQTIALSQALLWGLLNILRSRRIRDWALLAAPLLALVFYLAPHLFMQGAIGPDVFARLVAWQPSRYFGPTPVGMAAGAIHAAAIGEWLAAGARLLGGVAYLLLTIALGGFILGRLYAGEVGAYTERESRRHAGRDSWLQRLATNPLAALAIKEARYYWRDPRHKSILLAPLFPLVVVLAGALTAHMWTPLGAIAFTTSVCLMGFASLFQNIFGIDREGLRLLFVTPCGREDILIGKNIASVAVATLATSIVVLAVGFVLGDAPLAAVCASFVFPMAVIMATIGNLISIHFPVRLARRGENPFTASSGAGCLTGLINMVGVLVEGVVALPIIAGAVLPTLLHRPLAYGFTVPGSVLYAAILYACVLRYYSAGALEQKETKILEECLAGEPR